MSRDTGPTYPDGRPIEPQQMDALTEYAESYRKAEPLPALHQNREDAALGAAWRRVEAALPDLQGLSVERWGAGMYLATADDVRTDYCPTPTAALESLADKLEAGNG